MSKTADKDGIDCWWQTPKNREEIYFRKLNYFILNLFLGSLDCQVWWILLLDMREDISSDGLFFDNSADSMCKTSRFVTDSHFQALDCFLII